MDESRLNSMKDLEEILNKFPGMEPEAVGLVISNAIEYLIHFHNYDFDKMLDTIKRVHNKINELDNE